jgi:hypothetical protein
MPFKKRVTIRRMPCTESPATPHPGEINRSVGRYVSLRPVQMMVIFNLIKIKTIGNRLMVPVTNFLDKFATI